MNIPMSEYASARNLLMKVFGTAPLICIETGTAGPKFEPSEKQIKFGTFLPNFFKNNMTEGHAGTIDVIEIAGKQVCVVQGRLHYNEGYTIEQVVFIARVLALWGCKKFLLTNASGGLRKSYAPGTIVNVTDHIRLDVPDPVIGIDNPILGKRFTSMHKPYTLAPAIKDAIVTTLSDLNTVQLKGVYAILSGPTFESEAEAKRCKILGADMVGMSSVPKVIVCRSLDLDVGVISVVTNYTLAVDSSVDVSHNENSNTSDETAPELKLVLTEVVRTI